MDNDLQFVTKLYATLCGFLEVKHMTSTVYRPQTNGQVYRYNQTIVARFQHCVASHHDK